MGSLTLMCVRTDSPAFTDNAPFQLVLSGDSLLDKSYPVLIPAIGIGWPSSLGGYRAGALTCTMRMRRGCRAA